MGFKSKMKGMMSGGGGIPSGWAGKVIYAFNPLSPVNWLIACIVYVVVFFILKLQDKWIDDMYANVAAGAMYLGLSVVCGSLFCMIIGAIPVPILHKMSLGCGFD
jgi:hypothetical protein